MSCLFTMIFTQKSMTKHWKFYQQLDPGKLGTLRGQTDAASPGVCVPISENPEWREGMDKDGCYLGVQSCCPVGGRLLVCFLTGQT